MPKLYLPKPSTFLSVLYFVVLCTFSIVDAHSYSPSGATGVSVQHLHSNLYRFTVNYPEYDADDLVFWIMPDGHWEFGHQIDRYFEVGTYQFGKAHVLKKNDTDFGIATHNIPSFSVNSNSSGTNGNIQSGDLLITNSWSASYDQWVYAILTFTNTTTQSISTGTLNLSFENNKGYSYNSSATVIPYNWANYTNSVSGGTTTTLSWSISNLAPGEQRDIYVAFDVSATAKSTCQLDATLSTHSKTETSTLTFETRNYPHDPNFTRIDSYYGPEYKEYDYCYNYSEILTYTVGFQNEGTGSAKDIEIEFNLEETYYQLGTLKLLGSSEPTKLTTFQYNNLTNVIKILFKDINLPGLNDPLKNPTFQETTGFVTFEIQTKCNADEELTAESEIIFISQNGISMPSIFTNEVDAIVREGNNQCIICTLPTPPTNPHEAEAEEFPAELGPNKRSLNSSNDFSSITISPNPCTDFFQLQYEVFKESQSIQINLLDVTGRKYHLLSSNKQVPEGKYQLEVNTTDLENGIYLVHIQIDGQNQTYKLLKW